MSDVQRFSEVATQQETEIVYGMHEKQKHDKMDPSVSAMQLHLVIGNPPYAHFNQLPQGTAEKVKKIIGTSEGDIYYAFIIKSINLLQEGGELIYIVPYHFFYNTHAKVVREHILKNGKIEIIIDLDEARLFRKANPETIIFKFRKGAFNLDKEKIKTLRLKNIKITLHDIMLSVIKTAHDKKSNEIWEYKEIKHFTISESWSTYRSSIYFQVSQISSIELGKIAKVGVGPVSGFDKAFHVSEDELSMMESNEKRLVQRFIKAENCTRYITKGCHYYVLIDDKISEDDLINNYPNIYRKLASYKETLSNRYLPKNKSWYHWLGLRNYNFLLENLHKRRIYVPTLDRRPYNRFSLGDAYTLPASDVIFIQPYDDDNIFFLLGYLNSSFFREYYLSCGGRRGGRIVFTQKMLNNVRIPLLDDSIKKEISDMTTQIINLPHINYNKHSEEIKIEQIIRKIVYNSIMK
jgi:adenine-specific DNA-methyltransferase